MPRISLPILLAAGLACATPVLAQNDLRDIVSGVANTMINQQNDQAAFARAQQLNSEQGYLDYLSRFPQGAYRAEAERGLAAFDTRATPRNQTSSAPVQALEDDNSTSSASIENALGLTRTQRAGIQTQLTSLGYATGVADGLWGSGTRSAIARWQADNGLSATGYVTSRQVQQIAQDAGPVAAPGPAAAAGDDPVDEQILDLSFEERRDIQRRLTALGYNTGGIDGAFGAGTRQALASWQRDEGHRATGYLTADQLRDLR